MQHKQRRHHAPGNISSGGISRLGLLLIGIGFIVVAGVIVLLTLDIPAPQTQIETPLDAKTFTGGK